MAKIRIKSEKLTPFGGIFPIIEYFNSKLSPVAFALRGWKRVTINGKEFEVCSIRTEKWDGMPCRMVIQRQRRMAGEELDLWEGEYTYRCIITNDYGSTDEEIVEFYNQRGAKERIFDDLDNGFGWNRLPRSFMNG